MKKLVIVLTVFCALNGAAQIATEPRTEEYATVRAVLSAPSATFSSATSLPNPYVEMESVAMELKDFVTDSKGAKFETVTEMLNYMNKFGWTLHTVQDVQLRDAASSDFVMLYTFKRKAKK
jgi:hypothetical protein